MNDITKEKIQLKSKCSINPSCLVFTTTFTGTDVLCFFFFRRKELAPGELDGRGGEWGEKAEALGVSAPCTLSDPENALWREEAGGCSIALLPDNAKRRDAFSH